MSDLVVGSSGGKPMVFPVDLVTQTIAVLAKRGVGKTYLGAVMAEEMLEAKQQVIVLDPVGVWWGLRASSTGRSRGYPTVIFGGKHADLPLDERAGELIANAVIAGCIPTVLDMSTLRKGAMTRFATAFLETLYRVNTKPMHLFVDEADIFAPQARLYGGDENKLLGAMEDIVRRGRARGIGCTLITQRAAVLNKNVLTQCEMLAALRMVHPRDISAVSEWVDVHGDPEQAEAMVKSLPVLPVGTAWLWSPAWCGVFARTEVRKRRTFDSSATPKTGASATSPTAMAPVDLKQLGADIEALAKQVKENDPTVLRRRMLAAEAEVERLREQAKPPPPPPPPPPDVGPALKLVQELQQTLQRLGRSGSKAVVQRTPEAPVQPQPPRLVQASRPVKTAESRDDGTAIPDGLRRILTALALHGRMEIRAIAVTAHMAMRSGTFARYLSRARAAGWVTGVGSLEITESGREALGPVDPLPVGDALVECMVSSLPDGAGRILRALVSVYPQELSQAELAGHELVHMAERSGTFARYLAKLRARKLVERGPSGGLLAAKELI